MKRIIIIALLATLVFASCKDFLVEEPKLTQSTEMLLSDYNGLNAAVAGAYSPLVDGTWYGAYLVLDAEMRAGNAMIPTNPDFTSGRMTVPYTMNYNESSTSGLWQYAYYVISAANNVMEAIDTEGEALLGQGITQADVDNLYAEALFLRALSHFDLLRTYARTNNFAGMGVPVILKTDKSAKEMPARNTVQEVYDQVEADLLKAETLMSPDYKRSGVTDVKSTCSLEAIQALLSRVYLYNQKWQGAADYATKVIASGKFTMWKADEYASVWKEDAPKGGEIIFEVYGRQANEFDEYWEGPSHMTNPIGYGDCAASNELIGIFEAGDVRGIQGIRTKSSDALFVTDPDEESGGQMWTMKYQGKGFGDAKSTPDQSNTVVLRLSEMYLIRAEALLNRATITGTSALADLNTIRNNRNASPLASAGPANVALERRLELNFEGHRWFDLARTGSSLDYTDGVGDKHLSADSPYWALPIPKRETDVNENLVQNPY